MVVSDLSQFENVHVTLPNPQQRLYSGTYNGEIPVVIHVNLSFYKFLSSVRLNHDTFVWANFSIARRFENGQVDG